MCSNLIKSSYKYDKLYTKIYEAQRNLEIDYLQQFKIGSVIKIQDILIGEILEKERKQVYR